MSIRKLVKATINSICLLLVSPLALPVYVSGGWDRNDKFFQFSSQLMSLFPGLPGEYLRRGFYRWVFDCVAPGPTIGFGTIFAQRDTSIGRRVYIGAFCNIGSSSIGDDVLIGSNVMIASPKMHSFDRLDIPINQQGGLIEKIEVKSGAWLGNGAIVLATVGDGAVVAAGSIVVKACQSNAVYAGNPAKLIRCRGESAS